MLPCWAQPGIDLQILELEIPMVLCLNMTDEAQKRIQIDARKLSDLLGIPVAPKWPPWGKAPGIVRQALKVWQENARKNPEIQQRHREVIIK
jgi:Fe2+ transport system protein B